MLILSEREYLNALRKVRISERISNWATIKTRFKELP